MSLCQTGGGYNRILNMSYVGSGYDHVKKDYNESSFKGIHLHFVGTVFEPWFIFSVYGLFGGPIVMCKLVKLYKTGGVGLVVRVAVVSEEREGEGGGAQ